MKTLRQAAFSFFLALVAIALVSPSPVRAQSVTSYDDLVAAINNAAGSTTPTTITLGGNITATPGLTSAQMIINSNLTIDGGGFSLDMGNIDRAFFIAGGNVTIQNLAIQNGNATGGTGTSGGGGGAGLGGAIFVGSGSYSGWIYNSGTDSYNYSVVASGISAPNVTLSNVSFTSNSASGGIGQIVTHDSSSGGNGGGGGMGGNGGSSEYANNNGGGGGGFGNGADGGAATENSGNAGANGVFTNVAVTSGASTSGGVGGDGGGAGGANAGGGGSGNFDGGNSGGAGGGGGVGGMRGFFQNTVTPNSGGYGGFGGGGGGGQISAGNGGFGGGAGGTGASGDVGVGGFGGGGGGVWSGGTGGGAGGFGAGRGANEDSSGGGGGGGLGAGGAVFVMSGASLTISGGSFSSNSTTAGTGYFNGSNYGDDLFLGANTTFNVSQGNLSVTNLGGAGNTGDSNVINNDPNAQGGITVAGGPGVLALNGTGNYYTGATVVNTATLALNAGASEMGTSTAVIGQNSGDHATLSLGTNAVFQLASNSALGATGAVTIGQAGGSIGTVLLNNNATFNTPGTFTLAESAGSIGTLKIGSGAGTSGAFFGVQNINGGLGQATLSFQQSYAFGSSSDPVYNFGSTLTGFLAVTQDGDGTTVLNPQGGSNTFSGTVTVNSGTLATAGSNAALAGISSLTINEGGTFSIGQNGGINDNASLNLVGGVFSVNFSNLNENLGAWSLTNASVFDFADLTASLTFASLDIDGTLQIWNYNSSIDFISIFDGTATGNLDNISFYSDAGQSLLGTATLNGDSLMVVPEPSPVSLALSGLLTFGGLAAFRRLRRS